jgi:hypothetical protein
MAAKGAKAAAGQTGAGDHGDDIVPELSTAFSAEVERDSIGLAWTRCQTTGAADRWRRGEVGCSEWPAEPRAMQARQRMAPGRFGAASRQRLTEHDPTTASRVTGTGHPVRLRPSPFWLSNPLFNPDSGRVTGTQGRVRPRRL